jgi:hypothetical protein
MIKKVSDKFIELMPEDNKLLMDSEKQEVFEKIICKPGDEDNFIEIKKDEALALKDEYTSKLKSSQNLEYSIDS